MNQLTLAFIEKVTEKAKTDLMQEGNLPVIWHLVKDGLSFSLDQTINTELESIENQETIRLASEWIEPEYAVQVVNAELIDPAGVKFEALLTVCHYPDERPVAWISKVVRRSNNHVVFIKEWVNGKHIPFGGFLYSPFEKLQSNPSAEAIATVRKLLGSVRRPMLKVI